MANLRHKIVEEALNDALHGHGDAEVTVKPLVGKQKRPGRVNLCIYPHGKTFYGKKRTPTCVRMTTFQVMDMVQHHDYSMSLRDLVDYMHDRYGHRLPASWEK